MIHVTEKAAEQIRAIQKKEGLEGHALRIAAIGGGCSGMSYRLAFDKEAAAEDKTFEDQGVTILVDKKSYIVLNGTTLDFTDGLQGAGFVFQNPNAKSTCGCGESFSS
jgi:iron-sulfur cluster assembly protein